MIYLKSFFGIWQVEPEGDMFKYTLIPSPEWANMPHPQQILSKSDFEQDKGTEISLEEANQIKSEWL